MQQVHDSRKAQLLPQDQVVLQQYCVAAVRHIPACKHGPTVLLIDLISPVPEVLLDWAVQHDRLTPSRACCVQRWQGWHAAHSSCSCSGFAEMDRSLHESALTLGSKGNDGVQSERQAANELLRGQTTPHRNPHSSIHNATKAAWDCHRHVAASVLHERSDLQLTRLWQPGCVQQIPSEAMLVG